MELGPTEFALVVLGGGLGSMARALLAGALGARLSAAGAIFAINAMGSFAIGAAFGIYLDTESLFAGGPLPLWFTFTAVGLLGGFTTVSTYALQVRELVQAGQGRRAVALALGSVVLCPVMALLGLSMGLVPGMLR